MRGFAAMRACLLLLLMVLCGPVCAAAPPPVLPDRGLLFELNAPTGGRPVYLFGTMHSEDPRVLDLPEPVAAALERSPALVLEAIPDEASLKTAAAAMRLDAGTTLADLLPAALYRDALESLLARGLPEVAVRTLKPWAAMTLLMSPPVETGVFLDRRLYRLGLEGGKEVLGLETTTEQLSVFDQLSDADQASLLRGALAAQDGQEARFDALIGAYLAGDLMELRRLSQAPIPGVGAALQRRLRHLLIDSRNARMALRIKSLPATRSHFIAVGALHLPGEGGLLARLAGDGYGIRRLY
jgi:uncharacterized protein YbaP (TraB family)